MNVRVSFSIVFVSDMARSVAFYRDVVGLPVRFETSHWTEMGTGDTVLALHLSGPPDEPADLGEDLPAGRCRPGFQTPELDAFHVRMTEHGVPCVQEPRDVFGSRVAQYADPDGLVFSVGEAKK